MELQYRKLIVLKAFFGWNNLRKWCLKVQMLKTLHYIYDLNPYLLLNWQALLNMISKDHCQLLNCFVFNFHVVVEPINHILIHWIGLVSQIIDLIKGYFLDHEKLIANILLFQKNSFVKFFLQGCCYFGFFFLTRTFDYLFDLFLGFDLLSLLVNLFSTFFFSWTRGV